MGFKGSVLHIVGTRIREGGGKILLNCLIGAAAHKEIIFYLDEGLRKNSSEYTEKGIKIVWVSENIVSRNFNDFMLRRTLNKDSVIIFLNGIPPLFSFLHANSFIFFQNALLLSGLNASELLSSNCLRFIKKIYLRLFVGNVNSFIVQTPSMKNLLSKFSGNKNIFILPFLPPTTIKPRPTNLLGNSFKFDFIYPATGYMHKNHQNLIQALKILSMEGFSPTVVLTLDAAKFPQLCSQIETAKQESGLRIFNYGFIAREDLILLMLQTQALIFPSLCESLGLPLYEANSIGMPIIASELDYVRDACDPVETFDPNSSLSIARAIKRFLLKENVKSENIELMGPLDFLEVLSDRGFKE